MTTAPKTELTDGRWLGRRGILRHHAPFVEDVEVKPGDVVWHTMVTAVADWAGIDGELVRWIADDGDYGYEVRINGLDDNAGISEACAYSINSLSGLAKVANDLRYEWEIITGVYAAEGIVWSVY